MPYQVTMTTAASKQFLKLPTKVQPRVLARVQPLRTNRDLHRLRVGEYRVIYRVDDAARTVEVAVVAHRREVYRDV